MPHTAWCAITTWIQTKTTFFPEGDKYKVYMYQLSALDACGGSFFCLFLQTRLCPMSIPVPVTTIALLVLSNVFMTFAWYGHLRYKALPLLAAIVISWGIAFFEYMLQVPANRVGYGYFSAAELKAIQEIISLSVFAVFSTLYLGESMRWNHLVGFALIVLAAFFIFKKW